MWLVTAKWPTAEAAGFTAQVTILNHPGVPNQAWPSHSLMLGFNWRPGVLEKSEGGPIYIWWIMPAPLDADSGKRHVLSLGSSTCLLCGRWLFSTWDRQLLHGISKERTRGSTGTGKATRSAQRAHCHETIPSTCFHLIFTSCVYLTGHLSFYSKSLLWCNCMQNLQKSVFQNH